MSERPPLKPVYLISGSDRPKVELALRRLRARFEADSVEVVSALELAGPDVVALCNVGSLLSDTRLVVVTDVDGSKKDESRPPTGGWKAADVEAVAAYLTAPSPGTVLAVVGLEVKKDAALAKVCARVGDMLLFDVGKNRGARIAWVADRFKQAGVRAEPDACALLIELVGEKDLHGLANEITKIATWAHGEPVGVAEVEQLVSPWPMCRRSTSPTRGLRINPARCWTCPSGSSRGRTNPAETPLHGSPPRSAVISTRLRQLKRLSEEGIPAREAATSLKMHPFYGEKLYRQAEGFSEEELESATIRFAELDLALKGGSRLAPDLELQRALIDVSGDQGRAVETAGVGYATGAETRRAAWAFLRPAVFLWIAPFEAALSTIRTNERCSAATVSASPAATAASRRFVRVLIVDR